jgi:adenylate cyclase
MPAFWRDHPWGLRAAALVLSALLAATLQWVFPGAMVAVEQVSGDLTWRLGAAATPERRIVIVDIDESSLETVGPWPWPRETIARLSDRLRAADVAVQVFDIVLDTPRAGDALLGRAWAEHSVVAGQIFSIDARTTPKVAAVGGALASAGCPSFAPTSKGYIGNSRELLSDGLSVGHLTPMVESDGVVRKIPAVICHEGRAYPSLALAALWRAAQTGGPAPLTSDWVWSTHRFGGLFALSPAGWLSSASLPGMAVPVDDQGNLRVPYRLERKVFLSVPASQVLNGSVDPALLRGTIALVGATAFGIGDVTSTPLSSVAAGVEVHAQTLVGMLDHRLPYTPSGATGLQILAMLLIGVVLLAVVTRRRGAPVKRLPIAGAALALACYGGAATGLWVADLWLPWFTPAVFALLAATSLATAEHALTRAQRERLSAHLGAYLPAPVAQRLMATDPSGSMQVNLQHVSVMVADVRNFSAFAAHRPAQETAALLHAFYCIAVDVVEQHGGVVENVVGDSVLAVWNAYAECAAHPSQALAAAKELSRATRALLSNRARPQDDHLVQPLALGIGIETGTAIVGSFGPARRRAHVALGEPVSVASRLQQMTQDLSMPILIGPQLAEKLPAGSTEGLGEYLLEGMSRQYALFAPSDWADLVPTEQLWAGATASRPEGGSRWTDELRTPGSNSAFAPHPQRDA